MKPKRKIISLLLCAAILLSFCPTSVFAEAAAQDGGVSIGASGLCEHHPEHTEDCGYTEGTPGALCNHKHTDECYTLVTECVHEHTADCYPAESVSGNTATPSEADEAEPVCGHGCSEESGCITKELDCKHEHNEDCGYTPATKGTSCGFVCEICTPQDSGPTSGQSVQKSEGDLATPSNAAALSVEDVQKLIDELPTADELAAMSLEEQQAVYTELQAAYEAYNALTDEQKAEVTGAEIFNGLFAVFNGMANTLAGNIQYIERSWNGSEVTEETKDISDYTEITSTTPSTDWNTDNGGYYVVTGAVNLSERVTVTGEVHLILTDNCALTASKGICVNEDNSLTIYATSEGESMGKLTATTNDKSAGIGGNEGYSGGTITIHGGTVTATSTWGAGIGGGSSSSDENGGNGGIITIYGGDITATAEYDGAGIGGGIDNSEGGYGGDGGIISIYGGTIKATSTRNGAGIGGGRKGNGGTIKIYGGTIEAAGGYGAGIGGGLPGMKTVGGNDVTYGGKGGTITITGGTVIAKSENGAGIGGGHAEDHVIGASGGTISITGGTVEATGDYCDIGGGGENVPSDKIVVTVTVTKDDGTTPATIGVSHVADTTKWSSDEDQHWHPCQVPDCNVAEHQSDMESHTWDNGTVKNNELVYSCEVCEYEKKYSCTGITVANYPKLEYNAGETLDLSGLKITATFGEGDHQEQVELAYNSEGVTCYIGYSEITHGATLDKRSHNGKTLYATFGSGYSIYAQVGTLDVKSTDTGVSSVTIGDKTVTTSSNNVFSVALDFGSDIPTEAGAVQIALADKAAKHTTPATTDGGQTWTFTVTAESGAAQQYTIKVSVTPPTDAECIAQAEAAIEGREWTVAQSTANTSEAVKTWIKNQLDGMQLYEADAAVTVTACTPAADNANGSFTFTVALSKGGETVTTNTVTGTITATITYPVTVVDGTGSGPYAENDTVTITANTPAAGQEFSHWTAAPDVLFADSKSSTTTFTMPAGAVTVTANFKPLSSGGGGGSSYTEYTITASAGAGGSITPSGSVSVREGRDKTFTITPDSGYRISDVLVDGKSVGAVERYTFEDMQKRHTIEAVFAKENPSTGGNPFTDVKESDWFYDDVMFVYGNGLMSGTSATTFEPYTVTTRAQIAAIFYRLDGSPAVEGRNNYTDVEYGPGTAWYYDAATWAQQSGVMSGYGNDLFGPNDPVTRQQLAATFYNYAKYKGYDVTAAGDLSGFADAGEISPWAQDAMKWAVGIGLMNGKGGGVLDPQGTATRAEVAAMLHNFIERNHLVPPAVAPGGDGGAGGTGNGGGGWTQRTPSPQTGDNTPIWPFATLPVSAAGLVTCTILYCKRRKEEDEEPACYPA